MTYYIRRALQMVLLVFMASIVSFAIIALPPGDYLSTYVATLSSQGAIISEAEEGTLRAQYGLDQPVYVQYLKWAWRVVHGELGWSLAWNRPVSELIGERIGWTILVSVLALLLTYMVAVPIGIYSAVHQYSVGDYVFTFLSFVGVAVPDFLLALVLMVSLYRGFGLGIGGLFSQGMEAAPWTPAKVADLLGHLTVPLLAVSLAGMAWLVRTIRAMLLDELRKPYVQTARAKGLSEVRLLWKYPIRIAFLPVVATIGWSLPAIFSGSTIVAIVLNLPTVGPLLLRALLSQDMFLAASIVLIVTVLTLIGTLISDVLVALLDPRIKYS